MGALFTRILFLILVSVLISSCKSPYALHLGSINLEGKQEPAAIQFSDIQLYKREALVNERREETAYLKALLDESKKITFEPDIIRQLDLVRAISGSLGLGFSPGSALEFKQAAERGDLQQQIAVTQLTMQLDQLKRDAELLRQKLASQTEPSQGAPGQIAKPDKLPAGPSVPDVSADLIKAINELTAQLKTTSSTPLTKVGVTANPGDVFMDRQAYRDELKMALNTTSLDELHDLDGNSLFRLQFNATVLPKKNEEGNLNRLGVLRMQIEKPRISDTEYRDLYKEWLNYVNSQLNIAPDSRLKKEDLVFQANPNLLQLGRVGTYYRIITLSISKSKAASKDSKTPSIKIVERNEATDTKQNWYLRVAVPPFLYDNTEKLFRYTSEFAEMIEKVNEELKDLKDKEKSKLAEINTCEDVWKTITKDGKPKTWSLKNEEFSLERIYRWAHNLASYPAALAIRSEIGLLDPESQQNILEYTGNMTELIMGPATKFLARFTETFPCCACKLEREWKKKHIERLDFFRNPLENAAKGERGNRTAVYLVSPTGRFQRLSTAARAADAVALAGALAADLPAQGLGVKGTASYSRSAQGKVDALERSPLVVGFSEPATVDTNDKTVSEPSFGWILGPKTVLNPEKQTLEFEQYIAPYHLSADLSIPGWWPYLTLVTQTAWAPNWRNPQSEGQTLNLSEPQTERRIRIPLKHNTNDMEGLTYLLVREIAGARMDIPSISRVIPSTVSLCQKEGKKVGFLIKGNNIWHATQVSLTGLMADEADIEVSPDMKGILVKLDLSKLPNPSGGSFEKGELTVGTRYGTAAYTIHITGKLQSDGKCVDAAPVPEPKPSPTITSVDPSRISVCEPSPIFVVQGKNLSDKYRRALLGTIEGTAEDLPPKDGSAIKVTVKSLPSNKIKNLPSLPLILITDKGVAKKDVELVSSKDDKCK